MKSWPCGTLLPDVRGAVRLLFASASDLPGFT